MSTIDYIDDLEAGELSIEFEGQEPQDLLEWALDRFAPRIAVSTAFQADGVALIDMVYELDPAIEIFSVDTGRLPGETFELIERLRDRYPGLNLQLVAPDARQLQAMVARHGPNLFYRQVEKRLLCCNVRKVQPLTAHLAGLDAWITGLRRDQWATRTDIRKVEIDHDHGAIVKLNPLAEWTEEEVWDYIRERDVPYHSALRPWLHVDRLCAVHACARAGRAEPRRPLVVGGERAQGVRDPLRGRDRRARARVARADRRGGGVSVAVAGEAREVALAEAQAVLAAGGSAEELVAEIDAGEVVETVEALQHILELGLQSGRIRALYGPGGEQAAIRLYRRLPRGARLDETARDVTAALRSLEGLPLRSIELRAVGPGVFALSLAAGELELDIRLGREGARLSSLAV